MKFKTVINIEAALLTIIGLTMIIPAWISRSLGEWDFNGFVISSLLCVAIGLPIWIWTRKHRSLTNRDGFVVVTFGWLITALAGALPFYFSGAIPNFTDAWFESMSGVTTTGSTIIGNVLTLPHLPNGIESLPHGILFWRSFIQWIGGMGIVVFTIAILPLLGIGGVQLFKAEVPGPVKDKISPRVRETAKYLWLVYSGFTLAEIISLYMAGMTWFDAVCHSLTTMPTGGFSTKNASIGHYDNPAIHYIIIFFMFIAGVNFSLHFRVLSGKFRAYLEDREFLYYLSGTLIVVIIIFITVSWNFASWNATTFRDSMFQTVSILTTTGYGTANYELWPYFAQFILLALMFIGAMGGSTGGGMKVARVLLIFKYGIMEIRRMLHARAIIPIRIGSRTIDESVIRNTLGFFLFYIMIFAFTTLMLTMMGFDLESSFGAAASAIGNIGPGLGVFGPADNYALLPDIGKWMLSICMLMGRLEIFTVLVIFSRTFWK